MTYSFLNITLNNDNTVENWTSDIIVEQYSTDTIIRVAYKNIDPNHYVYIMFESNGVRKIMKPTVEFAMKGVVGKTFAYQLTQYETQYYVGSKNFSIIIQSPSGTMIATKEFSFKMKRMPYAVFENLNLNTDSSLISIAKGVEDNARDIARLGKLIGGITIKDAQSDWNETDPDSRKYIQNKPTKVSQFENDQGYIKSADIDFSIYQTKNDAANQHKDISDDFTSKLAKKSDKAYVDSELSKKVNTNDISDLVNKTTLDNYYTKADADKKFITSIVDDLANYYIKSEVYNKSEVNQLISNIPKFSIKIVSELPTSNISLTSIYLLLRKTGAEQNDYYDEYVYIGGEWESIGSTKVNLSNYYTKKEVDDLIAALSGGSFEGYYNKDEINTLLANKVSTSTLNDYYSSAVVDTLLNKKVDKTSLSDYYTKTDTNQLFDKYYTIDQVNGKLDKIYDKTAVDNKFADYYNKTQSDNKYYDKTTADGKFALSTDAAKVISITSNGTYNSGEIIFPITIPLNSNEIYIMSLSTTTTNTMVDSYNICITDKNGTKIDIRNYHSDKTTFGDLKQILVKSGNTYSWKIVAYCRNVVENNLSKKILYTDSIVNVPELPDWIGDTKPSYTANEVGAYSKAEVNTKFTDEVNARDTAINTAINNLVDGAPDAMNTLKELSDAISAHKDVTDALNAAIGKKVDKETGKGLSTNDYTTDEKNKLAGIEAGAQVNPTKVSAFENDGNGVSPYATEEYVQINGGKIDTISLNGVKLEIVDKNVQINETDPTVPSWAKAATKPTYTANEVGAYSKAEVNTKLDDRLKPLEAAVGDGGSIDTRIANAVKVETDRALAAESALDTNLTTKITTALGTAKSYTDSAVARDNLVNILGEASVSLNGLLSKEDKRRLDAMYVIFGENPDEDEFVNTINEVLAIFSKYPEGTNIVDYLATKVNISDIVDNLTSDEIAKPLSAKQGKVLDSKIIEAINTVNKNIENRIVCTIKEW